MKVIIIGGGEVGFHVAKALSEEDYDITVIDIDPIKCRRASENLDVIVVEGNGASPNTLNEARVGDADYVLCLTRVDEVNLIASQQAHKLGANKIIARIRNQQYTTQDSIIRPENVKSKALEIPTIFGRNQLLHASGTIPLLLNH